MTNWLIWFVFQQSCDQIFSSDSFSSCQNLLDVESFSKVCMADMCNSEENIDSALCKTIAEYSRECIHAGGQPQPWRNATFCCKGAVVCFMFYIFSLIITGTATLKCLSLQIWNVHTTWSSWSIAVHVLTAAPPLSPARHVTVTTVMAAAALPVSAHISHYSANIICKHMLSQSCLIHRHKTWQ